MTGDRRIIGLTGRAHSGKDTVSDYLASKHHFWRFAFAAAVKDALKSALRIEAKHFEDPDLKEALIEGLGVSPRQLMQTLGTDWGRNMIRKDLWILIAEQRTKAIPQQFDLVFTDVRYENEADYVRSLGGQIWHVVRADNRSTREHESEDGIVFVKGIDRRLHNNSAIFDLHDWIDQLLLDWSK